MASAEVDMPEIEIFQVMFKLPVVMNDHQINLLLTLAKDYGWLTVALLLLGSFISAKALLGQVIVFSRIFILSGSNPKKFGAKRGAWAVITGATDGIGREFALQLAKAGFNILLVSRTHEKLREVAAEIESGYKVSTKTHAMDFGKGEKSSYQTLSTVINDIDIGVLVNNVGRSHEMPVDFIDVPLEEIEAIVEINVNATLRVTKMVLPGMIARKSGLILNLGSFAGMVPTPMLATYTGTKAFLASWSQALGEEVKSQGVVVQLLNTHYVVSKMSKVRRPSALVPTAKDYVRSSLSSIGLSRGSFGRPHFSTPYWSHAVLDWAMQCIGLPFIFIRYAHSMNKKIRKSALRKAARGVKRE